MIRQVDVDFLAHYGVKGMRWGQRRRGGTSKGKVGPKSGDALKANKLKSRAKTHGTSSLSNKELQTAITRMNLEQQYSRLAAPPKSKGRKFVDEMITNFGKSLHSASKAFIKLVHVLNMIICILQLHFINRVQGCKILCNFLYLSVVFTSIFRSFRHA